MPVQQGLEINVPEGLNENLVEETTLEVEGAPDHEDEMLLGGVFCPRIHRTLPPVGPTLDSLGTVRTNVVRRLSQHQMVVQNKCTTHGRFK